MHARMRVLASTRQMMLSLSQRAMYWTMGIYQRGIRSLDHVRHRIRLKMLEFCFKVAQRAMRHSFVRMRLSPSSCHLRRALVASDAESNSLNLGNARSETCPVSANTLVEHHRGQIDHSRCSPFHLLVKQGCLEIVYSFPRGRLLSASVSQEIPLSSVCFNGKKVRQV